MEEIKKEKETDTRPLGKENFILPAMGLMLLIMTLYRKPLEKKGGF